MKSKVVSYQITVPVGDYCFRSTDKEHVICENFDNPGGHPVCSLMVGRPTKSATGAMKPKECLFLNTIPDIYQYYLLANGVRIDADWNLFESESMAEYYTICLVEDHTYTVEKELRHEVSRV